MLGGTAAPATGEACSCSGKVCRAVAIEAARIAPRKDDNATFGVVAAGYPAIAIIFSECRNMFFKY